MTPHIDKQLLCTFTDSINYINDLNDIPKHYELCDNKIFVFINAASPKDVYMTYNVYRKQFSEHYKHTIGIHRKKQTNTLYSLNAMNRLIEDENEGVFNKNFQLHWENYKNSIILTNDVGVKIVSIKLFSIFST